MTLRGRHCLRSAALWLGGGTIRYVASAAALRRAVVPSPLLQLWTFNAHLILSPDITPDHPPAEGDNGWMQRRTQVAELVRAHRPALVAVQEATTPMLEFLGGELGMEWKGLCPSGNPADKRCALLYDAMRLRSCGDVATPFLSPTTSDTAASQRIMTAGVFEPLTDQRMRFAVFNTHLSHLGQAERLENAEKLHNLLADPQDPLLHGCSSILVGDFRSSRLRSEALAVLSSSEAAAADENRWKDVCGDSSSKEVDGRDANPPASFINHSGAGLIFCGSAKAGAEHGGGGGSGAMCRVRLDPVRLAVMADAEARKEAHHGASIGEAGGGGGGRVSECSPMAFEFSLSLETLPAARADPHAPESADLDVSNVELADSILEGTLELSLERTKAITSPAPPAPSPPQWVVSELGRQKAAMESFRSKVLIEMAETKEARVLLRRHVRGEVLSEPEMTALQSQLRDVAFGIPLVALLFVPGGSVVIVGLLKLAKCFGWELLPTAFRDDTTAADASEARLRLEELKAKQHDDGKDKT